MFNNLVKRIKSELKWRKQRREQAARAASIAVALTCSGALKKDLRGFENLGGLV